MDSIPMNPSTDLYRELLDEIGRNHYRNQLAPDTMDWAYGVLTRAQGLDPGNEQNVMESLAPITGWSSERKQNKAREYVRQLIKSERKQELSTDAERYVFIAEQNAFWDLHAQTFISREGLNGRYPEWAPSGGTPAQLLIEQCRKADKMTYYPGHTEITSDPETGRAQVLNSWRPSDFVPVSPFEPQDITPWAEHVGMVIPDDTVRAHVLDWLAYKIRHRDQKLNWHVLLGGEEGVGKDTILYPITRFLGQHNVSEIPATQLLEEYEDYLRCELLCIHEAQTVSKYDQAKVDKKLKRMKAAPPTILRVRMFGVKHQKIPNLIAVWSTTNNRQRALNVSNGNRRDLVYWSPVGKNQLSAQYFKDLYAWMDAGGAAAVIGRLLVRDLRGFNPKGEAPWTAYKDELVENSRSELETALRYAIEDQEGCFTSDLIRFSDIETWLRSKPWARGIGSKELSQTLGAIGCERHQDKTVRSWCVRNQPVWAAKSGAERAQALKEQRSFQGFTVIDGRHE